MRVRVFAVLSALALWVIAAVPTSGMPSGVDVQRPFKLGLPTSRNPDVGFAAGAALLSRYAAMLFGFL